MHRRQQSIISDVAILPIIISIEVWAPPGDGVVRLVVTDNVNSMSWMRKKRSLRANSIKPLETFRA